MSFRAVCFLHLSHLTVSIPHLSHARCARLSVLPNLRPFSRALHFCSTLSRLREQGSLALPRKEGHCCQLRGRDHKRPDDVGLLPLAQHRPSVEVRRLECGDELGDEHSVWKILCAILEWAARVSQSVSMRNAPWVSGELRASPCASSASTHCASPALDTRFRACAWV